MTADSTPWRFAALAPVILIVASFINVLSLLIANAGGEDMFFQLGLIDCFSQQFWQGDLRPDWCMPVNDGLGSPVLLFYFPLPFTVASLFYPLTWIGADTHHVYAISCFLATVATGWAAYSWLKDIVLPGPALLATVLLLFVPYRMELLVYRSAYAELWSMVWLPLLFKYARRIVRGEGGMAAYALSLGAMFLTHISSAVVGAIFSGLYVMMLSDKLWKARARYALAGAAGIALTAFYTLPVVYYRHFITGEGVVSGERKWVNTFLSLPNIWPLDDGQPRVVLLIVMTLSALLALAVWLTRKRSRVPDRFMQNEIEAFGLLLVLAFFLLVPLSAPLYRLSDFFAAIVFPWRMQNIFVLCLGYCSAVTMQWFVSPARLKTWKADYTILCLLMVVMSGFITVTWNPKIFRELPLAYYFMPPEYLTVWTSKEHNTLSYMIKRQASPERIPHAEFVTGTGNVAVTRWVADGIALDITAQQPAILRIGQFYFPSWQVKTDNGYAVLHPENGSGQMLIDVPAGEHHLTLSHAVANGNPWLVRAGNMISVAAALLLGVCLIRRRSLL